MPPAPAARKLMEEKGLVPGDIPGSGRRGQVLKADIVEAPARMGAPAEAVAFAPMATPCPCSRCARLRRPTMPRARSACA